jgi:hypothetical protein
MNAENQLRQLLANNGFALVRQRKHKVYRNQTGLTFVCPTTPSDRRNALNQLRDIRRVLRTAGVLNESAADCGKGYGQ